MIYVPFYNKLYFIIVIVGLILLTLMFIKSSIVEVLNWLINIR